MKYFALLVGVTQDFSNFPPRVMAPSLSISWLDPGEALGYLSFQGDPIQPLSYDIYHLYDYDFQFKPPLRISHSFIQIPIQHFHFNI